jgi:hypothetical protein
MNTTRHVATPCPSCGMKLDAGSPVDDRAITPEPGDFSVCIYCGHGLRYTEGLRLELVKDGDLPRYARKQVERIRRLMASMPESMKRVRGPQ